MRTANTKGTITERSQKSAAATATTVRRSRQTVWIRCSWPGAFIQQFLEGCSFVAGAGDGFAVRSKPEFGV